MNTAACTDQLDQITGKIIGCAIEVHKTLGPGLLEGTYEEALCIELADAGMAFERQVPYPGTYKGRTIGEYRIDLLVEKSVIVELKSVERFDPVFEAQVLTYLKVTGRKLGLLINFNSRFVREGIKRLIL